MVDDPERRYGAQHFLDVSAGFPHLSGSQYRKQLIAMAPDLGRIGHYPGSPMIAMCELGSTASYLFCDLDDVSVVDVRITADQLGISSAVEVVPSDGMTTLHGELTAESSTDKTLAHIDPYDPHARGPAGLSALELAAEVIGSDIGLLYWYGYSRPADRMWAPRELRGLRGSVDLWCGDVMVMSDATAGAGDLGRATTPGTGFGIVCANMSPGSLLACEQLGEELVAAYEGVPLPGGHPGYLDFKAVRVA
jgi:hypothetical protein